MPAPQKGHLAFELHGERLTGGWDLVRMRGDGKRENWLLIKEADQNATPGSNSAFLEGLASSVTTRRSMEEIAGGAPPAKKRNPDRREAATLKRLMDRYSEAQLATLVDKAPEGTDWVHEIKFDGYRLLGFVAGTTRLRTRNGNDWTDSFPAIVSALEKLKVGSAVLDMEAVLLDVEGKSSFQALQAALGEGGDSGKIVAYVFDLLHLDGKDLTKLSLIERKEKLKALLKTSKQESILRYSEHFAVDGAEMYKQACAKGLEGIISKRADARYVAGRQKTWLKVKCSLRQEFIIVGYSEAKSGARALGALGPQLQKRLRPPLCLESWHWFHDGERARTGYAPARESNPPSRF